MRVLRIGTAILLALLFVLVSSGAGGAEKTTDGNLYRIDLRLDPEQPVVGSNAIVLTLSDVRSNAVIDKAGIEVIPWMTMHGHGSPKKPSVKALGSGRYRVENIFYTMEGDWDLMVNIKHNGAQDTATFTVTGVKRKE